MLLTRASHLCLVVLAVIQISTSRSLSKDGNETLAQTTEKNDKLDETTEKNIKLEETTEKNDKVNETTNKHPDNQTDVNLKDSPDGNITEGEDPQTRFLFSSNPPRYQVVKHQIIPVQISSTSTGEVVHYGNGLITTNSEKAHIPAQTFHQSDGETISISGGGNYMEKNMVHHGLSDGVPAMLSINGGSNNHVTSNSVSSTAAAIAAAAAASENSATIKMKKKSKKCDLPEMLNKLKSEISESKQVTHSRSMRKNTDIAHLLKEIQATLTEDEMGSHVVNSSPGEHVKVVVGHDELVHEPESVSEVEKIIVKTEGHIITDSSEENSANGQSHNLNDNVQIIQMSHPSPTSETVQVIQVHPTPSEHTNIVTPQLPITTESESQEHVQMVHVVGNKQHYPIHSESKIMKKYLPKIINVQRPTQGPIWHQQKILRYPTRAPMQYYPEFRDNSDFFQIEGSASTYPQYEVVTHYPQIPQMKVWHQPQMPVVYPTEVIKVHKPIELNPTIISQESQSSEKQQIIHVQKEANNNIPVQVIHPLPQPPIQIIHEQPTQQTVTVHQIPIVNHQDQTIVQQTNDETHNIAKDVSQESSEDSTEVPCESLNQEDVSNVRDILEIILMESMENKPTQEVIEEKINIPVDESVEVTKSISIPEPISEETYEIVQHEVQSEVHPQIVQEIQPETMQEIHQEMVHVIPQVVNEIIPETSKESLEVQIFPSRKGKEESHEQINQEVQIEATRPVEEVRIIHEHKPVISAIIKEQPSNESHEVEGVDENSSFNLVSILLPEPEVSKYIEIPEPPTPTEQTIAIIPSIEIKSSEEGIEYEQPSEIIEQPTEESHYITEIIKEIGNIMKTSSSELPDPVPYPDIVEETHRKKDFVETLLQDIIMPVATNWLLRQKKPKKEYKWIERLKEFIPRLPEYEENNVESSEHTNIFKGFINSMLDQTNLIPAELAIEEEYSPEEIIEKPKKHKLLEFWKNMPKLAEPAPEPEIIEIEEQELPNKHSLLTMIKKIFRTKPEQPIAVISEEPEHMHEIVNLSTNILEPIIHTPNVPEQISITVEEKPSLELDQSQEIVKLPEIILPQYPTIRIPELPKISPISIPSPKQVCVDVPTMFIHNFPINSRRPQQIDAPLNLNFHPQMAPRNYNQQPVVNNWPLLTPYLPALQQLHYQNMLRSIFNENGQIKPISTQRLQLPNVAANNDLSTFWKTISNINSYMSNFESTPPQPSIRNNERLISLFTSLTQDKTITLCELGQILKANFPNIDENYISHIILKIVFGQQIQTPSSINREGNFFSQLMASYQNPNLLTRSSSYDFRNLFAAMRQPQQSKPYKRFTYVDPYTTQYPVE